MGLTRISATSVTDTDFKTSCKVATLTNITSFTATPNTVDGYTFSVGDRVLVKSQDNAAENGIYVVESVGTGSNGRWARAGDFRDNKGITNGAITFVERGTEANTFFFLGGLTSSVTVGSTLLTFNSLVTETATTVIGSSQPNITSVGTLTSLAVTGNANVGNILAGGFYFSNGSPFTVDSTQILNGNSNVKVAGNGNVTVSVTGISNVIVFTNTGANINGYANITGDGTIGGNLTVTGDFTVNGTTTTLNTSTLDVEDLNITVAKGAASSSAANGAGITVDGANATFVYNSTSNTWVSSHGANITGTANITGNANIGNLGTAQVLASANITAPQLISNIATGTAPLVVTSTTQVANLNAQYSGNAVTANTVVDASQPNITSVGTLSSVTVSGNANVGNLNSSNTVIASTLQSNVATGTAPLTVTSTTRVSNLNVANAGYADTAGSATSATSATTAGTVTTAAQPNITSVGTLTTLNVTGNANVGNLGTAQVLATANITSPQLISNVATGTAPLVVTSTTQVANLNAATAGSALTAGTVTTAAQPNITSVGTLSSLTVTANANVGNILAGGFYYSNGSPFTVDSTQIVNGNSNVKVAANGNVTVSVAGNANVMTITGTGANISGTANVTGNISVGNILASEFYFSNGTPFTRFTASSSAPSSPLKGDLWYDTADIVLYVRIGDGVSSSWLDISSSTNIFADITSNTANITDTLTVGGNANVGNLNLTGDIKIGGNDIRSSTGNVAITLNDKDVTVVGNLAVQGVTTTIGSQNYSVQDSIIDLHTFPNLAPLTADDGRDIGIRMHYFKSTTDKHAFLGWANDTSFLEYYSDATESAGVVSGTYGTIKVANVFANSGVFYNGTSNITVNASGNVNVSVAGNANVLTVTGTGANIAGTANVTGNTSVGGILTNNYYYANGTPLSFGGASFTSSSTAPVSPSVGDYWYDTSADILYIRINDSVSDLWIDITTIPRVPVYTTASSAPSSSQPGDYWYDTDTSILYLRVNDGTSDLWLDISTDLTARLTASATTPGSASLGDWWYDTATDILFQYINDGASDIWVDVTSTGNTFNAITATSATITNANIGNITGISTIANGNSNVIITANSNVSVFVNGNATARAVFTSTGANIAGTLNATGNANVGNLGATNLVATGTVTAGALSVTGNANVGNIGTNGLASAANLSVNIGGVGSYTFAAASFAPTGNATQDLGSPTLRWANVWGVASSALYADLAEKYLADNPYNPGTVVIFGGDAEITVTNVSHDTRIAGVISTNPAYLMNDGEQEGIWLPVALTGRVPCSVQGPVVKGDLLVASQVEGVAEKLDKSKYEPGCVIGKALENHLDNTIKTIEVVVGRF